MIKNKKIMAGWLALLAVALVYPVRYYGFSEKTVRPLPKFRTYQEAVGRELPEKIKKQAARHKCRGYIIPVSQVTRKAKIPDLPSLVEDVNIALTGYDGWKLCVSTDTRQRMRRRAEERFKEWASLGVSADIEKNIRLQKKQAFSTNYSARLSILPVAGDPTADVRLLLKVDDERSQSQLFQVDVTFMHPQTVRQRMAAFKRQVQQLTGLREKARVSLWAAAILIFLGGAWLGTRLAIAARRKKKEKQYRQFLLAEIEKREELINEGHYVTALELAEKYLKVFPEDTEIAAFKRRLLDFTNNDPEKAQRAFVEYKKLQARLYDPAATGTGPLLSRSEQEQIMPLLDYHPELKSSYHQLKVLEDTREKERQALVEAELARVYESVKAGDLAAARKQIRGVLDASGYLEEVDLLAGRLEKPAGSVYFFAGQNKNTPDFLLFARDRLLVGRPDDDISPDLAYDDRRVSRRHVEIYKKEDGTVVARDLGSAGGTFLNGEKIEAETEARLKNGDILTLGKIFDLRVNLYPDAPHGTGGLLLSGRDQAVLMVFSRVGLDITPTGLKVPGQSVEARLVEGILVIVAGDQCFLPGNGDNIKWSSYQYQTEVIK